MTSAQTANVSNTQGLDPGSVDIATTYSDGVAKFASKPSAVKYNYDTGYESKKMDVTITGEAAQAKPAITTTSLPAGTTGTPYTQALTASGTSPITWTRTSGKLPDGITLSSDGTISVTPTAAGSYSFTVKASNSVGDDSKHLTLKITNPPDWTAPAITTTALNPAAVGKPYTVQLEATGNPAPTWRITSGTLPVGLTLSADGSISGSPTRAGSFKFTVIAENAVGYAQKQFTLKTQIVPTITTTKLNDTTIGQSYSDTVSASGTTPLTWSADGLPAGLTFKDGTFSGKATTKGTYPVTVRVSNSAGTDTKILSIDVHAVMPVFGTTSLPVGTWNKRYSAAITMKKGTKPITVEISGTLPDGLTFDADKWTLSGIPNEACNARILTFTATNAEGSVSKDFALTVNGVKPKITTSSLPSAIKGRDYSVDVAATGNAPITWRAENLPAGLSLDSDTGAITGTPGQEGTFSPRLFATNGTGQSAGKTFTLTVVALPEILDDIIPEGDANESYKYTLDYAGTSPVRLAVTGGTLPNGLKLSTAGKISGTPKEAGEFVFTVTASNNAGAVSRDVSITINAAPPRVTGSLKSGKVGTEYSSGLKVKEGNLPVTWSMTGTLPAGLSFDAETGTISGTPKAAYKGYITVRAENSGGSHKKRVRLLIREDRTADRSSLPEALTGSKTEEGLPEILTVSKPQAVNKSAGHVYRVPSSKGGVNVPEELIIVAELGVISTDEAGMYDFTVTLSDDSHNGAELVYIANSDNPSDDDDIADFWDVDGEPITAVPSDKSITISVWLNPERVYTPVIAVRK